MAFNTVNFVDNSSIVWSSNSVPLGGSVSASRASFSGSIAVNSNASSPADSITYYFVNGQAITNSTISTNTGARFYIPYDCTIDTVYGAFRVGGTLGTNELGTLFIRKNDTTSTTISSAVDLSIANFPFNVTNLGITLAAGDFITFGFTTPAWGTNPTNVGCALSFT